MDEKAAPRWARDPRFDGRAIAAGALASGTLAVAGAFALLSVVRAGESPDVGPTAAALTEGFGELAGAALGLMVGCALAGCAARTGSRLATGLVAGALGYLLIVVPIDFATAPSDVSSGELLGFAAFDGVVLAIPAACGAMIGSALGAGTRRMRSRKRHRPGTK